MNDGWYEFANHTPGDFTGYMMVVNADRKRGVFYESTIPIDLCPNTQYEFAAWVVNMLKYSGIKPNITFVILDMSDREIGRYDTGDIPDRDPNWKHYGFIFSTTAATRVKIRMISNVDNPNRLGGNDIAIDDITFRACGPKITSGIGTDLKQSEDICENTTATFPLSADVQGSATLLYQWQKNEGNGWTDISGATNPALYTLTFTNAIPGTYDYRLTAAEPGNLNSPSCRTVSPVLTFRVNRQPVAEILSNNPVCIGDALTLDVNLTGTYEWRKPDGTVFSTARSPVLPGATDALKGVYTVTVKSFGCEATASVDVDVIPPPVPAVGNPEPEICDGGNVVLSASGGTTYLWLPSAGLSDPTIANPVASPAVTTLYTVQVKSGSCYREARVNVIVHKSPKADAGPDKKLLLGNDVRLNGKASGDGIRYFWTPALDIDNAGSLSPKVSPKQDTYYTLNVESSLGCVTAVDEVFVRVYQKLIIPSAFSPNGDSMNDVWNITAIDAFEAPEVKVMNRYGELVFESRGYEKAWDGKRLNHDLPPGVYYYIIRLRNDLAPLSGSVMIIR